MPKLPIENFGDFFFGEISEKIFDHYESMSNKCVSKHVNPKLIKKWIEALHTSTLKEKTHIKEDDYLVEMYQYADERLIINTIDQIFQKYHLGFTLRYLDICISKNNFIASDLVNVKKIKGIFEKSFQIAKSAYDHQCDIILPDEYTFLKCGDENTKWIKFRKEDPYFIDISEVKTDSFFFSNIVDYYQLRSNEYLKKQEYYNSLHLQKKFIKKSNGSIEYEYEIGNQFPSPSSLEGFENWPELEKVLLTFGISEDHTLYCLDTYVSLMLDDDVLELIHELRYIIFKIDYNSFGMLPHSHHGDKIFNPSNELLAYKITKVLNLPIPLKIAINQHDFIDQLKNYFFDQESIEFNFGRALFTFSYQDLPYFSQFLNINVDLDYSVVIRLLRDGVLEIDPDQIWDNYVNVQDLVKWLKEDPSREYDVDPIEFRKAFVSNYMLLDAYHTVIDVKEQRNIIIDRIINEFKIKSLGDGKYSIDLYEYIITLIEFHNFDYYIPTVPWVILDQYFAIRGKKNFKIDNVNDPNFNINYTPKGYLALEPNSELLTEALYDQLIANNVQVTTDMIGVIRWNRKIGDSTKY